MASSSSSSSSSAASASPPPFVAKKSFLRRIIPLFLAANLAVGAYLFTRTSKKQPAEKDEEAAVKVPPAPVVSTNATIPEKTSPIEYIPAPVKVLPPIPEDEQRQLFKWILEEKRKVKPGDPSEKKKIDEEKALLKQYIRAKSIPSL